MRVGIGMKTMTYSTAKNILDRGLAEILNIENEVMSFGQIMTILVDKKHQYQVRLSGAQALALKPHNEGRNNKAP